MSSRKKVEHINVFELYDDMQPQCGCVSCDGAVSEVELIRDLLTTIDHTFGLSSMSISLSIIQVHEGRR
jgi:hypothetical protein